MPHAVRHAHALKRFHDTFLALRPGHFLAIRKGEFDVLINSQIADQIEALENEPDFAIADSRAPREVQILDRLSIKEVLPARWSVEQAHDREQRGLATSRRSGDGDVFAFANGQM